jgi:hypothetical protein
MGKREGKRPLGRPRRIWEDGIRMDLREIGWESVEWIQLAQDRDRWRAIVNTVINFRVLAPWRLYCSVQTIAGIASLTRCHTCTSYKSATVKNLAVFLTFNSCLRTSSYHWRYTCISEHYQSTLLTYIDLYAVKNIVTCMKFPWFNNVSSATTMEQYNTCVSLVTQTILGD